MRYLPRVSVDVVYCELCDNPYRRAAGACDNCGQSGPVHWEALKDEARDLRLNVFVVFALAVIGLVVAWGVSRGALLLLVFPLGFGGLQFQRLLAIQRVLRKQKKPETF